jgi:hypothetical protein
MSYHLNQLLRLQSFLEMPWNLGDFLDLCQCIKFWNFYQMSLSMRGTFPKGEPDPPCWSFSCRFDGLLFSWCSSRYQKRFPLHLQVPVVARICKMVREVFRARYRSGEGERYPYQMEDLGHGLKHENISNLDRRSLILEQHMASNISYVISTVKKLLSPNWGSRRPPEANTQPLWNIYSTLRDKMEKRKEDGKLFIATLSVSKFHFSQTHVIVSVYHVSGIFSIPWRMSLVIWRMSLVIRARNHIYHSVFR